MTIIEFLPVPGQLTRYQNELLSAETIHALIAEHLPTEGQENTSFRSCIAPLLAAMRWNGDRRALCEALPYGKPDHSHNVNPMAIRNFMANLGYNSSVERLEVSLLDIRLLPCLFMPDGQLPLVIVDKVNDEYRCFDSVNGNMRTLPRDKVIAGNAVLFTRASEDLNIGILSGRWFAKIAQRFETYLVQVLILSFFITLMALSSPLMIMAVYDTAIASSSYSTLTMLAVGMTLLACSEAMLRAMRARSINFAGARLDNITSRLTFERLLYLPPAYTERATIASQLARIKDFESVREFLTGHLALTFLELPFTLMFIMAIGCIGGMLCLVPISILGLYMLMIAILRPRMKKAMIESSRAGSVRHEFLIEYLSKIRAIRNNGCVSEFLERYRAISGVASLASFRASMLSQFVEIFSYVCMILAGIAILTFGVWYAADNVISTGTLIATMILSWRVLAPLQFIFSSVSRIEQLKATINQMQRLMQITPETQPHALHKPLNNIRGKISFQRVGLRYSNDTDPALLGVSFTIEPGELVVVRGANGSGKSTLVRLLIKLYQPQSGSIRIDDVDLRQLDPLPVRQAIAYVPQQVYLFRGTIMENILMARPEASYDEVVEAATQCGLMDDLKHFHRELNTVVGGNLTPLPYAILQGIGLSRAMLKDSAILAFDEVSVIEQHEEVPGLLNTLQYLRGKKTILFITHREDITRIADKLLIMQRGEVLRYGPAQEVLKQIEMG